LLKRSPTHKSRDSRGSQRSSLVQPKSRKIVDKKMANRSDAHKRFKSRD